MGLERQTKAKKVAAKNWQELGRRAPKSQEGVLMVKPMVKTKKLLLYECTLPYHIRDNWHSFSVLKSKHCIVCLWICRNEFINKHIKIISNTYEIINTLSLIEFRAIIEKNFRVVKKFPIKSLPSKFAI